jgi:hypothetical protein
LRRHRKLALLTETARQFVTKLQCLPDQSPLQFQRVDCYSRWRFCRLQFRGLPRKFHKSGTVLRPAIIQLFQKLGKGRRWQIGQAE